MENNPSQTNRRQLLKQLCLIPFIGQADFKNFDINTNEIISLRANENPYGPSVSAIKAMQEVLSKSNRYNWDLMPEIITTISKKHQIKDENVLMAAGSTEILGLVMKMCSLKPGNIVIADPTFDYWARKAEGLGLKRYAVSLTEDKKLDLLAMAKAINNETRLVYLCNPNNPTGTICERRDLIYFINKVPKETIVLLDEAYIEFTYQESLAAYFIEKENVITTRTFSKIYGLAGARVGYAIAHKKLISQLSDLQLWPSGSISLASTAAAIASLKEQSFVKSVVQRNQLARKYTVDALTNLNIKVIDSYTNFIYFSLENYEHDFFERLKSNQILGTDIFEENGKWTRITIGTLQEMQKFIKAIS